MLLGTIRELSISGGNRTTYVVWAGPSQGRGLPVHLHHTDEATIPPLLRINHARSSSGCLKGLEQNMLTACCEKDHVLDHVLCIRFLWEEQNRW